MTTASSGSGWTRPNSFFSRMGWLWPSRDVPGLLNVAGCAGPLMIRSALALLLSATQMTLPGRGTGGSQVRLLTGTAAEAPSVTARSTTARDVAQSSIRLGTVRPG
jgi:hypothetical protein